MRRARSRLRRPRTGRVRAALALGTVTAVGVTGTFAYWSDTATVSGTTLSSGTLDLDVNGQDTVTGYTDLSLTGMVPGSSTAGVLTVQNNGTVPVTYYATSTSNNATLNANLTVKVTADATVTGTGQSQTCAGNALPGSGTSVNGALLASAGSPRQLAVGGTQALCIQATLSPNAPNGAQNQSTTVTLTFTGNQVP